MTDINRFIEAVSAALGGLKGDGERKICVAGASSGLSVEAVVAQILSLRNRDYDDSPSP